MDATLWPQHAWVTIFLGNAWCIGRCICRAARKFATLGVAIGRVLDADLFLWVARDLAHRCRTWRGGLGLPPHRSRNNHDFNLAVVSQSRDERVHRIITLHSVIALVGESQNGLSPPVNGSISFERGRPTPTAWEEPPAQVVEQGSSLSI